MEKLEKQFNPVTPVLNTLTAQLEKQGDRLGPSLTTQVYVNGVPAETLIDTGSPATVISLEFVLQSFAKTKPEGQSPSEWREETRRKFSLPSLTLKAYSGHHLSIPYQVAVELQHASKTIKTVVLVQEEAPHELLLGTDLLPKLGFALVAMEGAQPTDLLTGQKHSCRQEHPEVDNHHRGGSGTGPVLASDTAGKAEKVEPPPHHQTNGEPTPDQPKAGPLGSTSRWRPTHKPVTAGADRVARSRRNSDHPDRCGTSIDCCESTRGLYEDRSDEDLWRVG